MAFLGDEPHWLQRAQPALCNALGATAWRGSDLPARTRHRRLGHAERNPRKLGVPGASRPPHRTPRLSGLSLLAARSGPRRRRLPLRVALAESSACPARLGSSQRSHGFVLILHPPHEPPSPHTMQNSTTTPTTGNNAE